MNEARNALQPLAEAEASYERLQSYETPAELGESVAAVWAAVERTLRLLVRNDAAAPDEIRLNAYAREALPLDAVVTHLRRRELISLELGGMLHEFERVAARVAGGSVRAADGDVAARTYDELRSELEALLRRADAGEAGTVTGAVAGEAGAGDAQPAGVAGSAARAVGRDVTDDPYVPTHDDRRRTRRLMLFAGFIFLFGGVATLISVLRGPGALEAEAVSAFREERFDIAERAFGIVLERQPANVNAMLYLSRIYRRQGRMNEASEMLQTATTRAPDDADVRRELGHLFNDLQRPAQAAEQFRRAVELNPGETANWIALIQALRAANDASAEEWLRRAPDNVRAVLTPAPPQPPFGGN